MTVTELLEAISPPRPLPGAAARTVMAPPFRRQELEALACLGDPKPAVPSRAGWREAAVLVLFYESGGGLRFPLIVRPDGPGVHAGQVSLPGGAREPEESPEDCALRETREEIGVDPGSVRLVRALTPLHVPPSRFLVRPFAGVAAARPEFRLSGSEVAVLLEPRLDELLDPAGASCVDVRLGVAAGVGDGIADGIADGVAVGVAVGVAEAPCYELAGYSVWGATAMILSELRAMIVGELAAG